MKTRTEELKELLAENQEKISELASSSQEYELIELWDLIDERCKLTVELYEAGVEVEYA